MTPCNSRNGDPSRKRYPVVELADCIFCGVCVEVCPAVFGENTAGYVEVADMDDYPLPCVDEAVKNCPENCIYWEND